MSEQERFYFEVLAHLFFSLTFCLWCLQNFQLLSPSVPAGTLGVKSQQIFPTECRQSANTYKGRLTGHLRWWVNGQEQMPLKREFGEIPVMVKVSASFEFLCSDQVNLLVHVLYVIVM